MTVSCFGCLGDVVLFLLCNAVYVIVENLWQIVDVFGMSLSWKQLASVARDVNLYRVLSAILESPH
jgi:hypothetical protein